MKTQRKKGFTMVELVIVIAVIAILAAVLIPTFVNLTKKANEAAALADARNIANQILADMLKGGGKDILVFEQKGDELYIHGYCAEAGRVLAYYGNPVKVEGDGTLADKVAAQLNTMVANGEVVPAEKPEPGVWWHADEMAKATVELGYSAETTVLRADYKIMPVTFVKDEVPEEHTCSADTLTHYEGQEPNCTQAGYEEYWICNKCGKMYGNENATGNPLTEIKIEQALGHNYVDGVCTRCQAKKPSNGGNNGGNTPAPNPNPNPGPEPNPEPEKSAEEQLVDRMNAAISGYTGESIMKALAYMADKDVSVTVSSLVHSDPTKTFAYDIAAHRFYIVNAADGTVEYPTGATKTGDLVYVINKDMTITSNMTRIYINNIETIDRSLFVDDATKLTTKQKFIANFVSVEIGAGVKEMRTAPSTVDGKLVYKSGGVITKKCVSTNPKTHKLYYTEEKGYYWYNRTFSTDQCEFAFDPVADAECLVDPYQDCFYGCTTLKSVYIGSSVTYMGKASFAYCTAIEYVYYNANASTNAGTTSGDYRILKGSGAAKGATLEIGNRVSSVPNLFGMPTSNVATAEVNLTKVVFESGSICATIEDRAFQSTKISEITLPKSLSSIGGNGTSGAFTYCTELKTIYWYGNPITCGGNTYSSSSGGGYDLDGFQTYMRGAGTNSTVPGLNIVLITD